MPDISFNEAKRKLSLIVMTKILVFGTFDGLHEGHLNFFKQAKKYGNRLMAVIARDLTVKKVKKRYCYKSERKRLNDVMATGLISKAFLGHLDDPYRRISEIKPDIICLGYDQKIFTDKLKKEIKKRNLKIKVYRMKAHKPKTFHSSILKHVRHLQNTK